MIDWKILLNALWVLGLAVLLAMWSQASYETHITRRSVWKTLATPGYALALDIGTVLLLVGLAATDSRVWAQILLALLALAVVVSRLLHPKNSSMNE